MVDLLIPFLSFLLINFKLSFVVIKIGAIFALLTAGILYLSNLTTKSSNLISYMAAIWTASILSSLFIAFLKVKVAILAPFFSIPICVIAHFLVYYFNTRPAVKAILIGNRQLVEQVSQNTNIYPIGAICFDDESKWLAGFIPNLGNLERLPIILNDLKSKKDITLIADRFIADEIHKLVECPVISIDSFSAFA